MRDSKSQFIHGLKDGMGAAGLFGVFGAVVVGGLTAICSGPVVVAAAVAAGLFGLFGAAGSALGAATSGTGDYRASWAAGIPTTAVLVAGILAFGAYNNKPEEKATPSPTALTQSFKTATSTQSTAGCVPSNAYPRSNIASTGPTAPGG